MSPQTILPNLILLQDFEGDWNAFYNYVYTCFKEDFINNPLKEFQGKKLGLKRFPLSNDNKEATFYHMTHEGVDEQNRQPDIRRMERIRWPKCLMLNCNNADLKVWKNRRGRDIMILIFHVSENYLLVLADRGTYILPWTAYLVNYSNKKRRLLEEYEAYKKAEAAKKT